MEDAGKMEQVIRRTAVIAHDYNNLLTAINGYSDLVAGMLESGHTAAGFVEEIRKAGAKAAELTQELLVLSRLHDEPVFRRGPSPET